MARALTWLVVATEMLDGSFGFDFAGTYTKVIPMQRLEYSFGKSAATIEFIPKLYCAIVRVAFDADDTLSIEQQESDWQAILYLFARYVEGKDVHADYMLIAAGRRP